MEMSPIDVCRWRGRINRNVSLLVFGSLLATAAFAAAQTNIPAFPYAEGFGRFARGGRGGAVYHVTNLDDRGAGSFRDAVAKPNRTIVFDVGGVIRISERILVSSNLTLAGETAPGGGITIYGNGVSFSGASHCIVRYLRFRMGVHGDAGKDAVTIANGHDMMFDHLSVSWGRDENFSISGPVTNVTIQNCIIGQGLQPHSAGGLIQTAGGVSILRTLYIDNHTRNPKVKGANQFVNNVVYNWGGGGCYILGDSENDSFANVCGNYFIRGPSSTAAAFSRGNLNFHLFAADNFQDADRDGVIKGAVIRRAEYGTVNWQEKPYDYPNVAIVPPTELVALIAKNAGASLNRDSVDSRLIEELLSAGNLGETIRSETDAPMNGPGTVQSGKALADTDQDGMPDSWEKAHALDPNNPDDRNVTGPAGYTRLEEYLQSLCPSLGVPRMPGVP